MSDDPQETIIESHSAALEVIKNLFAKGATFYCEPVPQQGWLVLIYDEGRKYSEADAVGSPSGHLNEDKLAEVMKARRERERNADEREQK